MHEDDCHTFSKSGAGKTTLAIHLVVTAGHSRHRSMIVDLDSQASAASWKDSPQPDGKLIFHIFAALAEFERSIIQERTRAGLDAARARGRTGGRPPALSAADLAAAKALLRDPEITVEQVAKRLNVSPSTLYRHLPGGRSAQET